ncbi:MAG: hypothetical protein ACPGVZ_00250 [Myxococcota bacterium]
MNSPKRTSRVRRRHPLALAVTSLAFVCACASDGENRALPTNPAARDAEIAELEERVARDRAALTERVATGGGIDTAPFHEDEELRALAERLTADADRLERLHRAATSSQTQRGKP